jgi:hypothetical protein
MANSSEDAFGFVRRFVADPPLLAMTGVVSAGAQPDQRIALEPGLSDDEIERLEGRFKFAFPPDLRALLSAALPVSEGFPNWRSATEEDLEARMEWPADGICFDIQHNEFWHKGWGPRPLNIDEACTLAREQIADAPTLIPIFGHRYLPDQPAASGNPVFSIHQSDVIHYGRDLPDYLEREFRPSVGRHPPISDAPRVPFWSDLL